MNRLTICLLAFFLYFASAAVFAADPVIKTVAEVHQEKAQLSGEQVQINGKVVKINNQIMGRNFLHLQDGTGQSGTNDLTITSQETAQVGDTVIITGTVSTNVDFGSGYLYPLLIEKATIAKVQ
ncbi:hypothetical protein MNBD_GAMMA26-2313 [hydrothermal vent metagenome]|uniref:Bacterial OB-fold domain-containing protein n=1 Tax=hydrothermal vent metagenome TaxID=652676 RepID=A0A3B1B4S4_9ZZZZ